MITVVIPTLNSAVELQALLPALVPAAVDGLVRDVIVVDDGSSDATLAMCEDAGAVVVTSFAGAADRARSDVVLALPAQMRLAPGWETRVGAHLGRGNKPALLRGVREGWFKAPTTGVLAPAAWLKAAPDLASLKRRLGPAPARL
jgi:cellulose synthase/poly-beta-1,6-N-acetylglucosamine synthase-like glycosyltransferase